MFKFKCKSLADAFSALILAYNGEKVLLEIPENLKFTSSDIRLTRFIDDTVFRMDDKRQDEVFNELLSAAEILNKISPNTFYTEKIFALAEKNMLKDFANHFRSKAYREISTPDRCDIFASASIQPNKKMALKLAPAYRCNFSRLVVAIIKTIKDLGSEYEIVNDFCPTKEFYYVNVDAPQYEYHQYKIKKTSYPLKSNTLYAPDGIYMYQRCNDYYISTEGPKALEQYLPSVIDGYTFSSKDILEETTIEFTDADLPLQAYLIAEKEVKKVLGRDKLKDIRELRLNGSNFEFQPSIPDVVGYADYNFDLVKRMGINVDDFKNATFDFGTHIEEIINTTYDLHPVYHNGQKSFEAAIKDYKEKELINCKLVVS